MKQSGRKVTVAGHLCLDITPLISAENSSSDINKLLSPGKLISLEDTFVTGGGAVSNTGLALCALGIDTDLQARVGDDLFGDATKSFFKPFVRESDFLTIPGEKSSFTIVLSLPGFDRILLHQPGVNDTFCADDIDYCRAAQSCYFHFGYPTLMRRMREENGAEVERMFQKIRSMGLATGMDLTLPDTGSESGRYDWASFLKRIIPLVDVFTPSFEEILFMLDREEHRRFREMLFRADPLENLDFTLLRSLGAKIIEWGAAVALIKCGKNGLYIKTSGLKRLEAVPLEQLHSKLWSNRELFCESFFAEKIISTTGAGDSCIAGFISALISNRSIEQSLRIAAATGARSIRGADSFSSVGTLEEVELFAAETLQNRVDLPKEQWSYDCGSLLWHTG